MPLRRLKCKACSNFLVPWGKTRLGKKRFFCKGCGFSRTFRKKATRVNPYNLFKQYVLWGLTYQMLSSMSGYSIRYLEGHFHTYLKQDPPKLPLVDQSNMEVAYLLIDGLWFGRWFVLMVYRQSGNLIILHISVVGREVTTKIAKDLIRLKDLGYHFTGFVSDGGTGIVGAINKVFPNAPHQICLAHMHRDVIAAIGRYPKDPRVKGLKLLADLVWLIESKEALRYWTKLVKEWVSKNLMFLKEKRYDTNGNWWFIHRGIRKATRTLLRLPEHSFTFLEHHLMPKTTNELEASFGHLGKRWLSHRGLKRERWQNFMKWFVYFYNLEKMTASKSRED